MKEDEVLDINLFKRVKKTQHKLQCNLLFALFDSTEPQTKI